MKSSDSKLNEAADEAAGETALTVLRLAMALLAADETERLQAAADVDRILSRFRENKDPGVWGPLAE